VCLCFRAHRWQAAELAALADFTQHERCVLLEHEAGLAQQLKQVCVCGGGGRARHIHSSWCCYHLVGMVPHASCWHAASHFNLVCFHEALACTPAAMMCVRRAQLRDRATAAENGASDALAETAALEQQLEATKDEVRVSVWWRRQALVSACACT
jgi:hypothetical protein